MTLNSAWDVCLRMFEFVAERKRLGDTRTVTALKKAWLDKHLPGVWLEHYCSFCGHAYKTHHAELGACMNNVSICRYCPGKAVDKLFSCKEPGTSWCEHPEEFYEYLVRLNNERLSHENG